MSTQKILLVEDSAEVRIVVEGALAEFDVLSCATVREAETLLAKQNFDCIILDIQLPDGDGVSFFSKMRARPTASAVPTIFLTSKGEISQKIAAFSLGAEDFLTKPFEAAELRARVQARLKKSAQGHVGDLRVEDLTLIKDQMKIVIGRGENTTSQTLTALEFRLLNLLLRHVDQIYERDKIIDEVWGSGVTVVDRTVDAHVSHLRKKLLSSSVTIEAMPGIGYKAVVKKNRTV